MVTLAAAVEKSVGMTGRIYASHKVHCRCYAKSNNNKYNQNVSSLLSRKKETKWWALCSDNVACRVAKRDHIVMSMDSDAVKAVLFDMDGVLCNSEVVSRQAAAEVMKELYGLDVSPDEFIAFTGTGEANFLGGVARKYGAPFEVESCKAKFFEIYLNKYAVAGSGIGCAGAKELVERCRENGLKTAVASSADLVKVHANLKAAEIPLDLFDAVVSADAFENLKPAPDIFLAAAREVGADPRECVVIEDAVAGVQAARRASMRVIGVTTTLKEEDMLEAGPDRIFSDISKITVEDICGLELKLQGENAVST